MCGASMGTRSWAALSAGIPFFLLGIKLGFLPDLVGWFRGARWPFLPPPLWKELVVVVGF